MSDLTCDQVRALLRYDEGTGEFFWRAKPCPAMRAGSRAGRKDRRGYWGINIQGRKYAAHRVAWLYVTGKWPQKQIDHINRDPSDNRFSNLRDVAGSANCLNRTRKAGCHSELRGVSKIKKTGRWQAQICVDGAVRYIGVFATEQEASAAYEAERSALL